MSESGGCFTDQVTSSDFNTCCLNISQAQRFDEPTILTFQHRLNEHLREVKHDPAFINDQL